ncbi:Subtilisin-like protease SBT3.1 [Cardamine amara subsp. amara]|uniref:Subtilisin-like protease SBT3.1 n=1 Tax=Cardamine amara subsp. amara TaxID=228776 RepID=A0ABD1APU4_CARAN
MKKTLRMDCSFRLCFVAITFGFVLIMNGTLSSATTPHEADPPLASNFAFSPAPAPSEMDDDEFLIFYEPVLPFAPEFPVYIFYLGERKHDDPKLVTQSHLEILKSVLGSEEAANKSIIYSYHHGFSGFAAKLKPAEAEKLKNHPEVIMLVENRKLVMQTTRTWDYLGQFSTPTSSKGLLHETNMGSGAIIGVIDSGIWSESGVFDDNGYGSIPKHWKGQCVSADQFCPADCNNKLIGAKYYIDGLNADLERSVNSSTEYLSPRDHNGHGTQVSSTIAGSFISNITLPGLSSGSVMRGGAPKAHIAMYKACWDVEGGLCSVADVWKAIDEAIHDGVDVLSVSIGGTVLQSLDVEIDIAIPALHAVNKGIPVVSPAGNGGARFSSVINISPWILTVAATTLDRSFSTLITLGNNKTLLGQSLYTGPEIGFTDLISTNDHGLGYEQIAKGKVIMHFSLGTPPVMPDIVHKNGGIGLITVRNPIDSRDECLENFPCIYLDLEAGSEIYFYMQTTSSPKIKISPYKTIIGERVVSKVGDSSGRGPSSFSPAILKPDIAAPGVTLLTPRIPTDDDTSEFAYSGTSMATPVIAGIVALLKISHPNWSPAAIKSALVTTAMKTDPYGERLTDGTNYKEADSFDYGGGLVNLEKATDPGLVYDMDMNDYIHYLCSEAFYTDKKVLALTGNVTNKCPSSSSSILDVNVPSITIPDIKRNVTVTRTVTNVGPVDSVYKPVIEAPLGFNVAVSPEKLVFNNGTKNAAFTVIVSPGSHRSNTAFYFGSLTWSDGLHNVTIPVSLRTRFIDNLFV